MEPAFPQCARSGRLSARGLRVDARCTGMRLPTLAGDLQRPLPRCLRLEGVQEAMLRARGLQIGKFSDPLGLAELRMPAVLGVGGSLVYFMESGHEREVWDDEFIPLSEQGPCRDAGLLSVDHIAQTMQYE